MYIHLPVAAVDSLTKGQDALCLPKNNYSYIVLKPVFIHLRIVDLVLVSLTEGRDTLCLPKSKYNAL